LLHKTLAHRGLNSLLLRERPKASQAFSGFREVRTRTLVGSSSLLYSHRSGFGGFGRFDIVQALHDRLDECPCVEAWTTANNHVQRLPSVETGSR
jgi:hypothetical protein